MSNRTYLLGYDLGSSSIKASVLDADTGRLVGSATAPKQEMEMQAIRPGWAEQDPALWWQYIVQATKELMEKASISKHDIKAIGISYKMHGLVVVDKNKNVLRPSIIWCDSRVSDIGERAFQQIGEKKSLELFLNSPGNFTASKLRRVKENEPGLFERIDKIMLPGDFIGMKLTGRICTTVYGLSEGIFWNFQKGEIAQEILDLYEIPKEMLPEALNSFADNCTSRDELLRELGQKQGTSRYYRAVDQTNKISSLTVVHPGEVASTEGTSGVIYGITYTRN